VAATNHRRWWKYFFERVDTNIYDNSAHWKRVHALGEKIIGSRRTYAGFRILGSFWPPPQQTENRLRPEKYRDVKARAEDFCIYIDRMNCLRLRIFNRINRLRLYGFLYPNTDRALSTWRSSSATEPWRKTHDDGSRHQTPSDTGIGLQRW